MISTPPSRKRAPSIGARLGALPEVNVVLFGFLLNYPWEFLQVPFFEGMPNAPHWEATKLCSRAAVGDAAILLVVYWAVSAVARDRRWIARPRFRLAGLFVALGLAVTVAFEHWATGVLGRWQYSDAMPVVPLLQIGATPFLQWVLLPLLLLWLVRRQIT